MAGGENETLFCSYDVTRQLMFINYYKKANSYSPFYFHLAGGKKCQCLEAPIAAILVE